MFSTLFYYFLAGIWHHYEINKLGLVNWNRESLHFIVKNHRKTHAISNILKDKYNLIQV